MPSDIKTYAGNEHYGIIFAEEKFYLHSEGALFWAAEKLLILSDLHLEKGSYFAQQQHPLPLYDTRDTLQRLEKLIAYYHPDKVLCLGDNLHDPHALERMQPSDAALLKKLVQQTGHWRWIIGNHDRQFSALLKIKKEKNSHQTISRQAKIRKIHFLHENNPRLNLQITGHYHPKITIKIKGCKIQGKCFAVSENLMIMPSFGSYTGGLEVMARDFKQILQPENTRYYLLKNHKVWPVKL